MPTSPLSPYLKGFIDTLGQVADKNNNDGNCRTSVYEAISGLVEYSANVRNEVNLLNTNIYCQQDCIDVVRSVLDEILRRLSQQLSMQVGWRIAFSQMICGCWPSVGPASDTGILGIAIVFVRCTNCKLCWTQCKDRWWSICRAVLAVFRIAITLGRIPVV